MISDENWEKFTDYMFEDAFKEYLKTDSYKEFEKRYNEISETLFDNSDNISANKINRYLCEFNRYGNERAKALYTLGMKDAISLLKKINVL